MFSDDCTDFEIGVKYKYFSNMFSDDPQSVAFRHRVAAEYTLGLCWVLRYYYQVCYHLISKGTTGGI